MAKRNLTVQLDEDVIRRARVAAAQRGTSVSQLVAQQLRQLADDIERYEESWQRARTMMANAKRHGGRTWTRNRAMHTALAVDDTWALARATRSVARAMTSTGQRTDAIVALTGMTDRMRPELASREHELLSLFGMLFLAASIAAAEKEDRHLALLMHHEAEKAADRLGPSHETHETIFGHANVAAHRVAALVRMHEGGRALEYADSIDPALIAVLPPERRANYLLDLTEAYAHVRRYREAVRTLGEAERVAPEEVRCRPLAHGLLRSLLNNTSGELSRLVQQMAKRAGVAA